MRRLMLGMYVSQRLGQNPVATKRVEIARGVVVEGEVAREEADHHQEIHGHPDTMERVNIRQFEKILVDECFRLPGGLAAKPTGRIAGTADQARPVGAFIAF